MCHTCTRCFRFLFALQTQYKGYLLAIYMSLPDIRVLSTKLGSKCVLNERIH